jgi:uncharacterized circularly permuted ATP-grasp superfamily protein
VSDAVAAYHDLLARGTAAADTQAELDRLQTARGLRFGDRPLCTVLRPRFLTPDRYRLLRSRVGVLAGAFLAANRRGLADPSFRTQFALRDWEESLLAVDPGFDPPHAVSRMDTFLPAHGPLRVSEYNTESPAGAAFSDALAGAFAALPVAREFRRRFHARPLPCRAGVVAALLAAFERWQGNRITPPAVAILDWREVPTRPEFELFADAFRSRGVACRVLDPRELEYRGGRLVAGDFAVTLVYKRVFLHELVARCGLDTPLVRAVRDRAVCLANAFRCRLLAKKASLAVLSDEANADTFTDDQRRAIREHVPWTRVVADRRTTADGRPVDLLPFVLANRHRLVLKPNDDHGGRGVVLGWAVDAPAWEAAVRRAAAEPHVVQERIPLPAEPYPTLRGNTLHVADYRADTGPFVAGGAAVRGCLTRVAPGELVTVAAGGSTVPTFLVEPR